MSQKIEKKSILDLDIGRVNLTQKAIFAKNLSVMLKSGLAITEALSIAQSSATGKLKSILGKVLKSVESGSSLSKSFAQYPKVFPGIFISATNAGEASGTLVENLENVSEQLEKEKELVSKIKGAMLYPIVVLIAAFILGMVLAFVVLPKITPLFEGLKIDLPLTTQGLIWFSNFVQDYGVYLFIGIIAFVVLTIWLLRRKFSKPFVHWFLLKTPIIKKISKSTNLARFSRTLAMLLKSGISIDKALGIIKETTGNYYYQKALNRISQDIQKGTKLSDNLALSNKLFPVMLTRMIKVGEESGKFEETLFYLADYYELEVDTATKSLSTAIEPFLLIMIGLVVGFLALSIITPIYDITGGIKR